MAREINLVPDIKNEMIKTLKLRNMIFFICIIVAAASVGATLIFGLIAGGQQIALNGKKETINNLSSKLSSFSDLNDYLTIKDQLGNISTLTGNKQVLSRTFNILSAMIPTGPDTITISELTVDFSEGDPTLALEAQANAGSEPFIDYNVLDAFKKSMQYLRYDFGRYVDKEGNEIPAYCMIETGDDGAVFKDQDKGIYAYWTINGEGCNPSAVSSEDQSTDANSSASNSNTTANNNAASGYSTEDYKGEQVVRVWRTPQYSDWYKEQEKSGEPYMSLDGQISGVPHFQSKCIKYSGIRDQNNASPKWSEENTDCLLVTNGINGIEVTDSSNGRGSDDQLVLRFSAKIMINPEVYKFSNYHMLAIAPSGRQNVTDSYVQVQAMFSKRAEDCAEGDTACLSNSNQNTNNTNNANSNTNSNTNNNNRSNGGNNG